MTRHPGFREAVSISSDRPQIDYAAATKSHRQRWIRRSIEAGLLIALLATSPGWWPRVKSRAELLLLQRRCMNYSAPPDRVVFDTEPAGLQLPPGYQVVAALPKGKSRLLFDAPDATRLISVEPWQTIVFMHSRSEHSANQRLVVVTASPIFQDEPDPAAMRIDADLYQPATITHGLITPVAQLSQTYRRVGRVKRVFAGQPDPSDSSHFTFVVETLDKTLHYDGWLINDTVKLEPREGYPPPPDAASTTLPAPSSPGKSQ